MDTITPAEQVGRRARELRVRAGLTQRQLAEKANMVHQEVSRFEGGAHDARLSTVFEIARALGVPVEELVKEDNE